MFIIEHLLCATDFTNLQPPCEAGAVTLILVDEKGKTQRG